MKKQMEKQKKSRIQTLVMDYHNTRYVVKQRFFDRADNASFLMRQVLLLDILDNLRLSKCPPNNVHTIVPI